MMESVTSPNPIDGIYDHVLAQTEILVLAKFRREQEERRTRQKLQEESRQMQRERANFLQAHDASPMSANDYERWLTDYVSAGGELHEVRDSTFPAVNVLDQDEDPIFQQLARDIAGPSSDIALEYYSQPVFWTIEQPVELTAMPQLLQEPGLRLHLTPAASKGISRTALQAWYTGGLAGSTELYLDGIWYGEEWRAAPWACANSVCIWQENYRNMRASTSAPA